MSEFDFITGIDNVLFLDWPGGQPGQRYGIRPISRADIYKCAGDAQDYIKEMGLAGVVADRVQKPDGTVREITYEDLAVRDEHLAVALRRAGNPVEPLFGSAAEVRAKLTSTEADKHYFRVEAHMAKCAPLTLAEALAEKESFAALIDLIKKNQDPEMLSVLPPPMLRRLIVFMAAQLLS